MRNKALVVDDNTNNLLLEKDLLEVAGFEVFEAENATSGIALARQELPDVIVMDVRLPDMRGTEAARILRQDAATRDIPDCFRDCFRDGGRQGRDQRAYRTAASSASR